MDVHYKKIEKKCLWDVVPVFAMMGGWKGAHWDHGSLAHCSLDTGSLQAPRSAQIHSSTLVSTAQLSRCDVYLLLTSQEDPCFLKSICFVLLLKFIITLSVFLLKKAIFFFLPIWISSLFYLYRSNVFSMYFLRCGNLDMQGDAIIFHKWIEHEERTYEVNVSRY